MDKSVAAGSHQERDGLEEKIQQLRKEKEALEEELGFLTNLHDEIQEGFLVVDANHTIMGANRWLEAHRKEQTPLMGRKCYAAIHGASSPCPWCPVGRALCSGQPRAAEALVENADGLALWWGMSAHPFRDLNGTVTGAIMHIKDITETKKIQEALHESRNQLSQIIDGLPGLIAYVSADRRYLYTNEAYAEWYGYTKEAIVGLRVQDVVPPFVYKKADEHMGIVMKGRPTAFENVAVDKEGKRAVIKVSYVPHLDEKGCVKAFFAYIDDITEAKQMENELRRSEQDLRNEKEKFRIVVEASPFGLSLMGKDDVCRYLNPKFTEIFGYTMEDIPTGREWFRRAYPDPVYRHEAISKWKQGQTEHGIGQVRPGTRTVRCKDGTDKVINFRPVAMETGDQLVIYEDVTETRRLEARLRQAQKMESIGTLAGGIAHDFNNILAVIIGNTDLALLDIPQAHPAAHSLRQTLKASERAKDLVKQILTFSRQSEQELRPVRMGPIVKEALKFLRASLPSTIEIRQRAAPENDIIMGDPTQIHQVLMNLCANALHAMQERGGILDVALENEDIGREGTAMPELAPGVYVKLSVRDTGHGMTPEIMERIFDPYFTTKEKGVGTGMGLATVHGIVRGHGGAITVGSEPGKGAAFQVYFPVIEKHIGFGLALESPEPVPRGVERVLFVEDEPALADLGKRILEQLGYRPDVKMSSVEALEAFRSLPDSYDLVITDMTMPGMTGDGLARELLRIRPDLPVILCTGFSERIDENSARAAGIREFVMKPFGVREMAGTIRRVLERGSSIPGPGVVARQRHRRV